MSYLEILVLISIGICLIIGAWMGYCEERRNRRNCFRAFGTCERTNDGYCACCHAKFYGGF